jgi:hypothetical protein
MRKHVTIPAARAIVRSRKKQMSGMTDLLLLLQQRDAK